MRVGFKDNKLEVFVNDFDLCYNCKHRNNCTVLTLLQQEAFILKYGEITLEKCNFFEDLEDEVISEE